uniref:Uncharacterized protein n=1 Tax=Avena sativa TaxID=4498 RepID=A0ACD5UVS9_AVESA
MEFATGAMTTLMPKLGELLMEEYKLQESVKEGIRDLKAELESMLAALVKVSSVPLDQLDPQVKIWANEVRELSYAIEDSLDSSKVRIEGLDPTKPNIVGFFKKACNKVRKLKINHKLANNIKEIERQVKKVKERYDRYKVDGVMANSATTTVDPRLSNLYKVSSDLVGIDKQVDKLMKILSEGSDVSQKTLNTVSIVGFGGLGKTTLAKALYDKLNKTYQCQGFIPVGQNPDMKKVLRDILLELDIGLYNAALTMDERQLIDQLQKFLAGKRYFIVIDDIWDIPTWETIRCVFMDSHPESKIVITTRIVDVAITAGGFYDMEPLSDDNSKILFYTRTSGGDGLRLNNQPADVTSKILKKCGGVPLAIITIASLLADKPSNDWSKVYDAIGFGHEDNRDVHNTRKILSFSYYDLPSYLKTCLLYISMFPEDCLIEKKTLIWRWIVEHFIPEREGIVLYEQGEIYFNELVNKSMIRWIEPDEYNSTQCGCRVHDMVLDLIRTISNEINFVTIYDMEQHDTFSRGKRTNRVRRLALHGGSSVNCYKIIEMEHVRSFAITWGDNRMPLLLSFRVLRVLVIEDCVIPEGRSLEHLGKLVHLRYLGLVKTYVEKLPEGIGHDLKFLEILDVRGGSISELPPSVGELRNLRCLWAGDGTRMMGEIGKLTCLEELQLYLVDKCPNFFTELGKLRELRVLEIHYAEMEDTAIKALVESLGNLPKIHSLEVSPQQLEYQHVVGGGLEALAPSSKLCLLSLEYMIIPRMPPWINSLCVPFLSHLALYLAVVVARDLQTLGRLPLLLDLVLWNEEKTCISYTFGSDEFHKLRLLRTNMEIEITIGEGALTMLEILAYRASARIEDVASLVPWNNRCPLLDEVTCWLDCTSSDYEDVEAAEETLKQAAQTHPNHPHLDIEREEKLSSNVELELIQSLDILRYETDEEEDITGDGDGGQSPISSFATDTEESDNVDSTNCGDQEGGASQP